MPSDKFQPLLSAKIRTDKGEAIKAKDMAAVSWPKFISPKIDGIRGWNPYGTAVLSRTMKVIPNRHVQRYFGTEDYQGADGELVHGTPYEDDSGITVMQKAQSGTSTFDGPDDLDWHIFDEYDGGKDPYHKRLERIHSRWASSEVTDYGFHVGHHPRMFIVPQKLVYSWDETEEVFAEYVRMKLEGAMLKGPDGEYLTKRSTLNENLLIKLKPWEDAEATIVGFEERFSNQNQQTTDERGYSKRSSHQENQVPMDTLGAFVCQSPNWTKEFKIGTGIGLNDALRQEIWDNRAKYLGATICFKYNKLRTYERPSIPTFRAIRWDI